MDIITKKVANRYKYIKKLINNKNDIKVLIDNQFYFNQKAFNYVNKINKDYFMNSYYNLTNLDYLLMVDESNNIYDVQNKIFEDYETQYASSVWSAFIECLERDLIEV
jgi:hypothetical protein